MWLKFAKFTKAEEVSEAAISEAVTSQNVAPMEIPLGSRLQRRLKKMKPRKCVECGTWGFKNECPSCGAKTKK